MDDDDEPDAAPQEVWVPVTIHIPLGAMKAWNPGKCAPLSLFCGPYAIILLAQTANTVLVPVLPFLITDTGSSATAYGLLQSTFWATETVLAPLLGALSDYIGRRAVIALSLLISAAGHALLATAPSLTQMAVARFVAGLGFQARARAILPRNSAAQFSDRRRRPPVPDRALQGVLCGRGAEEEADGRLRPHRRDPRPRPRRRPVGRRHALKVWIEATRGVARLRAVRSARVARRPTARIARLPPGRPPRAHPAPPPASPQLRPRGHRLPRVAARRAGSGRGEQATVALPPADDE